jgi:hypothetical protein
MNFADFKSAELLTSDKLASILAIWKELSAGRIAPKREEILPAKLRSLLPWTWIVDVIDGGADFRFRIAGDRIIEYLGQRYAGKSLSEMRGPAFFELMHDIFSYGVKYKRPIANGPLRASHPLRAHLESEVLVLPLSDDGENVTGLFGGFESWHYGTHFQRTSAQAFS